MRSLRSIIDRQMFVSSSNLISILIVIGLIGYSVSAQRISIVVPEKNELGLQVASGVANELRKTLRVEDLGLSMGSISTIEVQNFFNLYRTEARSIAQVLSASHFVIVRAGKFRRTSISVDEYYEQFAAVYTVSGASGELIDFRLFSFTGASPNEASKAMDIGLPSIASHISATIGKDIKDRRYEHHVPPFPNIPNDQEPQFKGLRPPMPFRRIRPEYTPLASLYSVSASVEAEVDIDEKGNIVNIDITRWAGFGLDGSVADAIRRMNWRPASVGARTLPMRVLLRYNFLKLERDEGN